MFGFTVHIFFSISNMFENRHHTLFTLLTRTDDYFSTPFLVDVYTKYPSVSITTQHRHALNDTAHERMG